MAPACANEACFLVVPWESSRRPSKFPLKHASDRWRKPDVKRQEEAFIVWNKMKNTMENPWILGTGVRVKLW